MKANTNSNNADEKVILKKELGFVGATSIVVGSIIGSGIFISPKGVLENTGSVGLCLVVWTVAGVISLGSGLCYAELGAMIGVSGGAYTYIRMGMGNVMAFIYVAKELLVRNSIGLLVMLLTFSKYLVSMFPTCGSPQHLEKMIAALTLVFLFLVNSYSSKLATRISVLTTLGKVAALLVICVGGVVAMVQGATSELPSGFSGTKSDATPIAMAFYNALWAYSGASFLNCLVEEVKSPDKNVPKSIVMGTVLVIFIYVMTNVSYLAVMTRSELLQSDAVAALFADRVLRNFSLLIPVAVMISTLGATNNALFGYSRVTFAAARDGNLPDCLSYVHITQFTPFGALALTVTLTLLYLIPADLGEFINLGGFLDAFFEACVFLSMIRFRLQTMKDAHRPVKISLIIPILMFLINVYLFIAPVIIEPSLQYIYVAISIPALSILLYIPLVYFQIKIPFHDEIVTRVQLIFELCPPTQEKF